MLEFLEGIMTHIICILINFGYWGVGIGMFLESACIPIPSEIVLPLAGLMASEGRITLLEANISVAVGSMAGSILAYFAGYLGGRPFILKYGKYFLISKEHFYKSEEFFRRHGSTAVFVGRLLPVVRTFVSLPSGITRMNFRKFFIYSFSGMILWNFILTFLGYKFGQNYDVIVRPVFKKFEYLVIGLLVTGIIYTAFKVLKHHE